MSELPTIHSDSRSTKLNELTLNASFKTILVAKTKKCFCGLALSFGRRELIMIFISSYFFLITRARLVKPSERTSGSLFLMLFVP